MQQSPSLWVQPQRGQSAGLRAGAPVAGSKLNRQWTVNSRDEIALDLEKEELWVPKACFDQLGLCEFLEAAAWKLTLWETI